MTKTIEQTILFKASPKKVYDTYVNAKLHAASTGAPAKISAKPNSAFSAHGGYITGKTLLAQTDSLIVQSWRGMDFKKTDADSILILYITPTLLSYFSGIEILPSQSLQFFGLLGIIFAVEFVIGMAIAIIGSFISISRVKTQR